MHHSHFDRRKPWRDDDKTTSFFALREIISQWINGSLRGERECYQTRTYKALRISATTVETTDRYQSVDEMPK